MRAPFQPHASIVVLAVSESETNADCVVVKRHHDYETKSNFENDVVSMYHHDHANENVVASVWHHVLENVGGVARLTHHI
uniref:Secreted protein n=1 Tax=Peronospora matthiolae TaxID=2874970 RepID=A0AAV1U1C1_9STRA